jgi:hypothetical protein
MELAHATELFPVKVFPPGVKVLRKLLIPLLEIAMERFQDVLSPVAQEKVRHSIPEVGYRPIEKARQMAREFPGRIVRKQLKSPLPPSRIRTRKIFDQGLDHGDRGRRLRRRQRQGWRAHGNRKLSEEIPEFLGIGQYACGREEDGGEYYMWHCMFVFDLQVRGCKSRGPIESKALDAASHCK